MNPLPEIAGATSRLPAVRDLASLIADGKLLSREFLERCLDRIAQCDPAVRAWVSVDSEGSRAEADRCDREALEGRLRGPLHGIPFAVKDIIDVAGWPTRAGSRSRADAPPAVADAAVVSLARAAGAIVLGKTHTTEFAGYEKDAPFLGVPPTRNPRALEHTPGGSSSGSAAAVAAGMVPLALGTQTGGSLTRPAAFCGVAAFKPSLGALNVAGILPYAPSFDMVGTLGAGIADAIAFLDALVPPLLRIGSDTEPRELFLLQDPLYELADVDVLATREDWASRIGRPVRDLASPVRLTRLLELNRTVNGYEASRQYRTVADTRPDLLSPNMLKVIVEGNAITEDAYFDAMRQFNDVRRAFWAGIGPRNAIILPPTPHAAPKGFWTGDPTFASSITVLGGPMAALPHGTTVDGRPLGVVVASAPGTDLGLARMLERLTVR